MQLEKTINKQKVIKIVVQMYNFSL